MEHTKPQRKIIGERPCRETECDNFLPIYADRKGNQRLFCADCILIRRRATNRRVAANRRTRALEGAEVQGPVFPISGGHFQAMPVNRIIEKFAEWQSGESDMV